MQNLTEEQQAELMQDYVRWSGGFTPVESDIATVREYIESNLLGGIDKVTDHTTYAAYLLTAAELIAMHSEARHVPIEQITRVEVTGEKQDDGDVTTAAFGTISEWPNSIKVAGVNFTLSDSEDHDGKNVTAYYDIADNATDIFRV